MQSLGRVLITIIGIVFGSAVAGATTADQSVDLQLVLAVDVSPSIDAGEALLQRTGYFEAFRHPAVIRAIEGGPRGRIAVAYFEWSGANIQFVIADWTVINDRKSAFEFADKLIRKPPRSAPGTSISGAIDFAAKLLKTNTFNGKRRVIDISGDGPNNAGDLVVFARDRAIAQGITINGLPILANIEGEISDFNIPNLDLYYKNCVIGGPGAFVVVADTGSDFALAVRRKMVMEIAGLTRLKGPPYVKADTYRRDLLRRVELNSSVSPPCNIGEMLWQNRYHTDL